MPRIDIAIAIPSSVLLDTQHMREKTVKLGIIARACSIYRVSTIYIYRDNSGKYDQDMDFSTLILEYLETPQYLRRTIFPIMEALKFAGALPPLRIPHHKTSGRIQDIEKGEIREGFISKQGAHHMVDAGLGALIPIEGQIQSMGRATVLFTSSYPELKCKVVGRDYPREYWGYQVKKRESISKLLNEYSEDFSVITSRSGQDIGEIWTEFCSKLQKSKRVLFLFGSPKLGVQTIMTGEGTNQSASMVINTMPGQGVITVRTEEAVTSSLSILNLASNDKMIN